MKTLRKMLKWGLLSLVLAAVLPMALQAAEFEGFTYTSDGSEITITGYTGPGGAVTIPDSIGGLPVARIGRGAFLNELGLTSVVIPDSVTSIGIAAFRECRNLTSITIPNGVTTMGGAAFALCTSLTSATIGSSVATIGPDTFNNCSILTSIIIPDSVTSIGSYAFAWCNGLTSITIGSGVTSIGDRAFLHCGGLTGVAIPDSVVSIGDGAFLACISLTGVYFNGDAPALGGPDVFRDADLATVYYLAGTTGWGPTYGGRPTALWINNPPTAGSDTLGTTEDRSTAAPVVKLLANDRDDDGDPLTMTGVSANSTEGGTVFLGSGLVTYTPPSGFAGTDQFTYTIRDDRGGTAEGTVVVTVTPLNAPSLNNISIKVNGLDRIVRFAGIPGQSYIIQWAADLTDAVWIDASPPITAGATGLIQYTDTIDPPPGQRFYRTLLAH